MTTYMHYATFLEGASALRSRKVSAVELTRALQDRIARIDPLLHSYATVTPELALKQAGDHPDPNEVHVPAGQQPASLSAGGWAWPRYADEVARSGAAEPQHASAAPPAQAARPKTAMSANRLSQLMSGKQDARQEEMK